MDGLCGFSEAKTVTNSFHLSNYITCSGKCMRVSGSGSIGDGVLAIPLIRDIFITISNTHFEYNFSAFTNSGVGSCDFRNRVGINIYCERIAFDTATIITFNKCCISIRTCCKSISLNISISCQRDRSFGNTILSPGDF